MTSGPDIGPDRKEHDRVVPGDGVVGTTHADLAAPSARSSSEQSLRAQSAPDGSSPARARTRRPAAPAGRASWWERKMAGRVSVWTRSLRLRVVVMTLVLSAVVMVGVGLLLQRTITDGLLENKQNAAIREIDTARITAEQSLAGADADPTTLRSQLALALQELGNPARAADTAAQGSTAGVFDPVIAAIRTGTAAGLSAGPIADVPADLRVRVAAGYVGWKYTTVIKDSVAVPALVVGAPATTRTDTFGVYLIFLLTTEQKTVAVIQQRLLLGGAVLAIALALIAMLVASQVVRPVRRASAVAERLAAGDLAERMPVRGATELTTLARSFNGMADAIRAQIRQLEEFGTLQRRFTSDVSHELRTPVTTVRMAADVLHAGRADFPPHLARATELLVAELDRFEVLLADLLEISRHDAGMAELNAEPVDVRSHVLSSVAAAGPIAELAGVRIVVRLPSDPVVCEVDARRLERILRNLLNNAVDHAEGRPVEVELAADDDAAAITVTDHGVGLRPGEAGLVFNRFWRADPSRQRHTGGTGLGLAISLEDARLHGGWLQAAGAPGQGARFRLTLPRQHSHVLSSSPLPLREDEDEVDDGVAAQPTVIVHPRRGER